MNANSLSIARLALAAVVLPALSAAAEPPTVSFADRDGVLHAAIGEQTVAEFHAGDEHTPRPYFARLRTLAGTPVTRNHPPVEGAEPTDHPTMHPGVWLAFGDLSGGDFWRNQGRVRRVEFAEPPQGGPGRGGFTVRHAWEHEGALLAREDCRIAVVARPHGWRLEWESTFHADERDIAFGDQEEMGLGVRVATPLTVERGGRIEDSQGRVNGAQVWGQTAEWVRYGAVLDGREIGLVLMSAPDNFRPSWQHARDYGLLVANPFGRRAFTGGEPSRVVVPRGESLRLGFAVEVHEAPAGEPFDAAAAYREAYGRP